MSAVIVVGAWRLVFVFPEVAYIVVGSIGTIGVQKVSAWRVARKKGEETEVSELSTPDVGEELRRLVGDGILLTQLQRDLKLPNTKAVKALLEDEGIEWKAGVRTAKGNGPGVHKTAIPSAPSPADNSHGDGCCCRSGANANTNAPGPAGREVAYTTHPVCPGGLQPERQHPPPHQEDDMSPTLTTIARALAYLVLFVGVPAVTAAATTHHMLDDTEWTDPQLSKPRPTAKPTPTKTAPSPRPRSTNVPWKLGDCVTAQLRIVDCTPGARRIVGWFGDPGRRPCAALPETTQVQRAGRYALCLADY
ncbi:hypothetical protein ABZ825_34295 [Streptomyces tauricus]|uniref:hypothetical protein n=1 Tax=Streptomyces tauricus TaxID=68274 RepID=UPI0033F28644